MLISKNIIYSKTSFNHKIVIRVSSYDDLIENVTLYSNSVCNGSIFALEIFLYFKSANCLLKFASFSTF